MKQLHVWCWVMALALSAGAAEHTDRLHHVLSRLQTMSHGPATSQAWDAAMAELDAVTQQALGAGDLDAVVQAQSVKAMALADMRRDLPAALAVLQKARKQYGRETLPSVRRLFVQEADVFGRMGDQEAVRRVIEEFRENPNYDPQAYPYSVTTNGQPTISVVRPSAGAADSTSVTAMQVARARAAFSPGGLFPAFSLPDNQGGFAALEEYRGRYLLIDFWQQGWLPWERDLAYLVSVYTRYQPMGFEILGVPLARDTGAALEYAAARGLPWRQAQGGAALARQLSIFGEASNYLVDPDGVIVAVNLRGPELAAVLREQLGKRP